jgi:formate hydrogenlyase transcriptional activator
LNVFPITLPALRERREDIPALVRHIVERQSAGLRKRIEAIPPEVIRALESYDWPGNVRELENVIQRAIILTNGPALSIGDAWLPPRERLPIGEALPLLELERRHIMNVLQTAGWRIEGASGAARILGMKPSTLRHRMGKLGIVRDLDATRAMRRRAATPPEAGA